MPGVFDASSIQFPSGDGTGTKQNIACWADVTISPKPTYQKFYTSQYVPQLSEPIFVI